MNRLDIQNMNLEQLAKLLDTIESVIYMRSQDSSGTDLDARVQTSRLLRASASLTRTVTLIESAAKHEAKMSAQEVRS